MGIAPPALVDVPCVAWTEEAVPAALASAPLGIAPPAAPPAADPPGADKAALLDVIELEDIPDIIAEAVDIEVEADTADPLPTAAEERLEAAPVTVGTALPPMPVATADGAAIAPVLSADPKRCISQRYSFEKRSALL